MSQLKIKRNQVPSGKIIKCWYFLPGSMWTPIAQPFYINFFGVPHRTTQNIVCKSVNNNKVINGQTLPGSTRTLWGLNNGVILVYLYWFVAELIIEQGNRTFILKIQRNKIKFWKNEGIFLVCIYINAGPIFLFILCGT